MFDQIYLYYYACATCVPVINRPELHNCVSDRETLSLKPNKQKPPSQQKMLMILESSIFTPVQLLVTLKVFVVLTLVFDVLNFGA